MKNLAAWTAPGGHYPQYVSVNEQNDGDVIITVRSQPPPNGQSASIAECRMKAEEFDVLVHTLEARKRSK